MSEQREPDDPLARALESVRSRVEDWFAGARAFPEQLWSETRQFGRDLTTPRVAELEDEDAAGEPERAALAAAEGGGPGPRLAGAATIVAERDDDASSVIGKIDQADEVDVLLVVPRRARELRDAMAWPRIAAHVRQRGLSVRVLASRRDVRHHAQSAGLPAARTVRGLHTSRGVRIPLADRELQIPLPPAGPMLRFGGFLAVVFVVAGAAAYYIPSADVVVAPPTQPISATARVRVNPVTETDISLGVVSATSVQQTVTAIVSTTTTGSAVVGDVPAAALLAFTNESGADVTLPVGTPVDDEGGFTFTTTEPVVVPAEGVAEVNARAVRPGTAGNLEADSLRLLIGFPPTLTVTNPEAAAGGTDTEVVAVAAEDVERVGTIADDVLRRAGERQLLRTVTDGTVFPETISVVILSQEPLMQVGEPGEAFMMEYTAVVSALMLSTEEAARAGEQMLIGTLAEGMALLPATTTAVPGGDVTYDGSRLSVDLTATGLATVLVDASALRDALTSVSPSTAAQRLRERLELDLDPLITVHPTWLPEWRMPRRAGRISLELVTPEVLAERVAGDAGDALGEGSGLVTPVATETPTPDEAASDDPESEDEGDE